MSVKKPFGKHEMARARNAWLNLTGSQRKELRQEFMKATSDADAYRIEQIWDSVADQLVEPIVVRALLSIKDKLTDKGF